LRGFSAKCINILRLIADFKHAGHSLLFSFVVSSRQMLTTSINSLLRRFQQLFTHLMRSGKLGSTRRLHMSIGECYQSFTNSGTKAPRVLMTGFR